ncbi:MAG TPA: hypothetical protein VFU17_06685 [Candidatus Limnocylindrales bacterium]|nr:hypothetical protein [Candidatus Limnocylindrales bacterium]
MTGGIRPASRALLAVVGVLAVAVAPVRAADAEWRIELWLDRPLPDDVAVGIEIPIGVMVWDVDEQALVSGNPPFVRLNPASGDAEPSMVTLVEDWNGHYGGSLPVPPGGMGEIQIGFGGTACDETSCRREETVYPVAGVGPPPAAPLPSIAQAEIVVGDPPIAGEATDVSILLQPNVGWSGSSFATPDQLFLQVREPRADVIDQVVATAGNRLLRYEAELTLPEAKDYLLQVAEDRAGAPGDVFGASLIPITVDADPTDAAPATEGTGPGTEVLIVAGLAGVVALAALTLLLALRRA